MMVLMSELTVRRALCPADVPTIRRIASTCDPLEVMSERFYWEHTFMFGDLCSVASVGYVEVGFLTASVSGQDGFLHQIGVLPEHRGVRAAAKMLDRTSLALSRRGARWLFVRVPPGDEAATGALEALAKRWSSRLGLHGEVEQGGSAERVMMLRIGEPHTFTERRAHRGW